MTKPDLFCIFLAACLITPLQGAASEFAAGVNYPWVKYGLDFGASGFGHVGLSSDCSEGFRPQTFANSQGITKCERSREHIYQGSFSLKAFTNLQGGDDNRANGEVLTDLQDIGTVPNIYGSNPNVFLADLDGQTLTARVFVPCPYPSAGCAAPGNRGDSQHPNFLQLFVKDGSAGAIGQQGPAVNIGCNPDPAVGDRHCDPSCDSRNGTHCLSLQVGACAGDCNGDRRVTAAEVVRGVRAAGSAGQDGECPRLDADYDGRVTERDIQEIARNVFGCFDPSKVRFVGVKVGVGAKSTATIADPIYVDDIRFSSPIDVNAAEPLAGFDFEKPSLTESDAERLAACGVKVLRWFVFADGRAAPDFDEQDFVTGLDAKLFADFDALLRLARAYNFKLTPVLFDYLLCGKSQTLNGVQLYGHSRLATDPARTASLVTNALEPFLARYATAPEILYWEIINEPEWCLSDLPFPPDVRRPSEIPPDGAVTTAQMQMFVCSIADAIHAYGGQSTIGRASYYRFPDVFADVGRDVQQFHIYNCPTDLDNCPNDLDAGKPLPACDACLMGEFPSRCCESQSSTSPTNVRDYLERACANKYAGALAWSWRGRDKRSPIGESPQDALCRAFQGFTCLLPSPTSAGSGNSVRNDSGNSVRSSKGGSKRWADDSKG